MKEFHRLLEIADRLLGPSGCPWDREQTIFTLQPYLLEETYELIEAIDSLDSQKMIEELGDVLYTLVFIAKLAETEGRFTLSDAIHAVGDKLIRRHPHVFGEEKASSSEEVVKRWEEIKKQEKASEGRKKIFDGIPSTLPALARAQKMARKLHRQRGASKEAASSFQSEEEWGTRIWELICEAEGHGIDAESALRRKLQRLEKEMISPLGT